MPRENFLTISETSFPVIGTAQHVLGAGLLSREFCAPVPVSHYGAYLSRDPLWDRSFFLSLLHYTPPHS